MKGLTYIAEVEDKLNKIYVKKGFNPKIVTKAESTLAESVRHDVYNQHEERKSSTRSEESPIIEERKD